MSKKNHGEYLQGQQIYSPIPNLQYSKVRQQQQHGVQYQHFWISITQLNYEKNVQNIA